MGHTSIFLTFMGALAAAVGAVVESGILPHPWQGVVAAAAVVLAAYVRPPKAQP